ncbi:hypothetical protein A1C_02185 [Rickettsia akari str. Hartford]|uniref:Uncharacterized protein n=1 Tax=Rickettsia akari (strain Hartford) TaxID=293614 RepID=A8GMW7_RICAH|nr:hypothetical protein A1C_02185 [Rickettsia akari str. Hartford]
MRLYKSSETQSPNPLIENYLSSDKTPALRSLSYIVFEELLLEDCSNIIPNFSFEATRKPNIYLPNNYTKLENLISTN